MKRRIAMVVLLTVLCLAAADWDHEWSIPTGKVYRITDHQMVNNNVDCYVVVANLSQQPVSISCTRTK